MNTITITPAAPTPPSQWRELWAALKQALKRRLCILRGGHQFGFAMLRRGNFHHRVLQCRACGVVTPYREPTR